MVKFIVTGTGHSGTAWVARTFMLLGLRCGHEQVFGHARADTEARLNDLTFHSLGESSLAAAAYLKHPRLASIPVLHVVRDPLAVTRSWAAVGTFEDPPYDSSFLDFLRSVVPEIDEGQDVLGRTIRYVEGWTRAIVRDAQGPYRMTQLEELAGSAIVLRDTVRWLGGVDPLRRAPEIGDVNRHRRLELTWDDIDEHPDGHLLRELAGWTGYADVVG